MFLLKCTHEVYKNVPIEVVPQPHSWAEKKEKKMLRIMLIMIIPFVWVNIVYADKFQITDSSSGFDVSHSRVSIADVKFEDFTDKFGRITIDIPKGKYKAIVNYRDKERVIKLDIDGSQSLKIIDLK